MTVKGLPGLPGGSAVAAALDDFTADCLTAAMESPDEICGIFWFDPQHIEIEGDIVDWQGQIRWHPLENVAPQAQRPHTFVLDSDATHAFLTEKLMKAHALAVEATMGMHRTISEIMAHGFSPFVGLGHSHPSGSADPSHADHSMGEATATWRRAFAPQSALLGRVNDARFFEADFLFGVQDAEAGNGVLVHYKRGSVRGKWEGNFLGSDRLAPSASSPR